MQKISTAPGDGQGLDEEGKLSQVDAQSQASQPNQSAGPNSYEQLRSTAALVGQVLDGVNTHKRNEVEYQMKAFRAPLETFRLMIIGAMSACQRYKLIVRFNHEKELEI